MPRIRRRFLIDPTEVGTYHCINRCVRRSFLCGSDLISGKNYDHRRQWIQDRIQFLAGRFGVDVLGFAVMSNHLHVVLRNRPDVVAGWSDDEVARRWWDIFPKRRDRDGHPKEPTAAELLMITSDAVRLAEIRQRLSSVSWFMRCLVEPIARSANREDLCSGRFWNGRSCCLHFPCLTNWKNTDVFRIAAKKPDGGTGPGTIARGRLTISVYRGSGFQTSLRSRPRRDSGSLAGSMRL